MKTGKFLLQEHYREVVEKCFGLPDTDFRNHYANFLKEHREGNPGIFAGLKQAVNHWFDWFKKEHFHNVLKCEPQYETLDNGERQKKKVYIPLPPGILSKERTDVDEDFFLKQIETIDEFIEKEKEDLIVDNLRIMAERFDKAAEQPGTIAPPLQAEAGTEQPKPDFNKLLIGIRESENQFWKGLPMEKVVSHFEIMATTKSKNGSAFLSNEQLISFLKKGFLNDTTQPKQKVNCAIGEKGLVIKRFYEFFDLAVTHYEHPQKTEKFINLFTDCFDNWNQKTVKSFFKPNKTKAKW